MSRLAGDVESMSMRAIPTVFPIRKATLSDYDAICALYAALDELHRAAHPDRFQSLEPSRSLEEITQTLADDDKTILVAEFAGTVVGFAQLHLRSASPHPVHRDRRTGVLNGLVVAEDQRRRGVAQQLMKASHEWFSARDAEVIELSVYAFNEDALGFYEANGFRPLVVRLAKTM